MNSVSIFKQIIIHECTVYVLYVQRNPTLSNTATVYVQSTQKEYFRNSLQASAHGTCVFPPILSVHQLYRFSSWVNVIQ